MIRFIVAPGHEYTFNGILDPARRVRELPAETGLYRALFRSSVIPPGTWVFCDIERLAAWELRLAGEVARLMRAAGNGFRVLNDPARAASRYELLFRLHDRGFNRFRAWRAEDGIPPARFPVFLRLEANHRKPLTGLIEDREALAVELDMLPSLGISRRGVLIIEYHAEALEPGVFRKYAAYRFGDRIVADHLVHDVTWLAKYGAEEAWNDARFAEEASYVRDNPHAARLMEAFEIARIDYGRADYGIVDGEIQVWEINTNPALPEANLEKAPPQRADATIVARDRRLDAIEALDVPQQGPPLALDSELLIEHRKRQKPGYPEIRE